MKNHIPILFFIPFLLFGLKVYAQPANDNCTGAITSPQDGTCLNGTTVAATDGWSGSVGCQSLATAPEVWYTFTATGTQASFTVTNGTMTGNVEIILVYPNCGSNNCTCPFVLEGSDCGPSPNSATFQDLIIGQVYYYTISSSTGSQGTFTTCLTVTNPPPSPGQDCADAATLCNGPDFSVPNIQLGDGPLEENWGCIGNENNSQWYTFTAGSTGSIGMMFDPTNWNSGTQTGDDYDFMLLNLGTSTSCPTTNAGANVVQCDYSACAGSTGWSATGAAGFGQVAGTDYANTGGGPFGCSSSPQWNTASTNLTGGNTYALLVQNYSGSTGGVAVSSTGTALFGPQAAFTITNACGSDNIASVSATYPYTSAGWSYSWNWGDGSSNSSGTTASHTYSTSGNYTITLTVTDPLGCTASQILSTSCTLPIELIDFNGDFIHEDVQLKWITSSETNNDYYTIERSPDGINYEKIGEVDAIGNSSSISNYSFVDANPFQGRNYYRLKQTDIDGRYVKYDPILLENNSSEIFFNAFPNPAREYINIEYTSDNSETVFIKVTDMNGRMVYRTALQPGLSGDVTWRIDTETIGSGIYMIYCTQGEKISYKKIFID